MITALQSAKLDAAIALREVLQKLGGIRSLVCFRSGDHGVDDLITATDRLLQKVLPSNERQP